MAALITRRFTHQDVRDPGRQMRAQASQPVCGAVQRGVIDFIPLGPWIENQRSNASQQELEKRLNAWRLNGPF
jgi:hypothetical protein